MLFARRRREVAVPEVGAEAPEFNLPSAQGGQLRLSMRTVRGPVVVVFFRGMWSEEDVGYFADLAAKEGEINHAGGSVVGIGAVEADEAREFARASGIKSYVLYDYHRVTTHEWGLLDKDREHGEYARPAAFVVGADRGVTHAWVGERPSPDELLATVSGITGLPKPAEEAEEEKPKRPKRAADDAGAAGDAEGAPAAAEEKPKKLSAEERERIKAERRAAREAGKSVKTAGQGGGAAATQAPEAGQAAGGEAGGGPKKMSAEERERIKAERRAAREAGKSVKTGAAGPTAAGGEAVEPAGEADKPKKMSAEERERIKAERRAAREAGKSLKQPAAAPGAGTEDGAQATNEDAAPVAEATEPPKANGE